LAAVVTRVFIREDKWDAPKLRAGIKGAVLGILAGGVLTGRGIQTYGFNARGYRVNDIYDAGSYLVLFSPFLIVINAISTAILRPGKRAARLFWGAWAGCALGAGLVAGLLARDLPTGVIAGGIAGTLGGLLAALGTRWWMRDEEEEPGIRGTTANKEYNE
jgi:hypothetical protein